MKNAFFLASVFATAAMPQNGPAFRSNVDIVVVPFTVANASGAAVGDLTRGELRGFDNGVQRSIENLWIDTNLPLTIGVIVDASESQQDRLAEHRRTVVDLLERILRPADRAFVIAADEDIRTWANLSGSTADIRSLLAGSPGALFGEQCAKRESKLAGFRPTPSCGSSPLWNAIYSAARYGLHPLSGNKALLVLSDGFDSGSTRGWNEAADAASRAGASVYAIQYQSGSGRNFAPDLYRLVREAGGALFQAPGGDYQPIVSRLEADLRHRYVLGFRPERLTGKVRHEVRVEVSRPDVTVRARKTYFLERQ